MKKATLLLICILLVCLMAMPASAAQELPALFQQGIGDFYGRIELLDDFFPAGELPTDMLYEIIMSACRPDSALSQYFTYTYADANGYSYVSSAVGQVPGDVLESYVGAHFSDQEAINTWLRSHKSTGSSKWYYEDGTYHFAYSGFSGFGDYLPTYCYLGYQDLGNGSYAVYGYRADTIEVDKGWIPYVPGPGDVEGQDYLIITTPISYNGVTQTTAVRGKILDEAVKAVMTVKNGSYAFTSYEHIDRSAIPGNLISPAPQASYVGVSQAGIQLTADPRQVGFDVRFAVTPIADNGSITLLNGALDGIATVVTAYDFTAQNADGQVIENFQGQVQVRLTIPEGCNNPMVFYIADDGVTVEYIEGKVEGNEFVCTLSHFSTYVLANKKAQIPQEPTPSTPAQTQPSQSAPAGSKPAESRPTQSIPGQTEPAGSRPTGTTPTESKPEGSKPTDSKPADSKPAGTAPTESHPSASQPASPKSPATGIVLAVILVLAIGGFILGFVMTKKKK